MLPLEVHVYHHLDLSSPLLTTIDSKLDTILSTLGTLSTQVLHMDATAQAAIDTVNAKLDTITTTVTTTVTELQGLAAQLAAALAAATTAGTDPAVVAAFNAVATRLDGLNTTLGAADLANAPKA